MKHSRHAITATEERYLRHHTSFRGFKTYFQQSYRTCKRLVYSVVFGIYDMITCSYVFTRHARECAALLVDNETYLFMQFFHIENLNNCLRTWSVEVIGDFPLDRDKVKSQRYFKIQLPNLTSQPMRSLYVDGKKKVLNNPFSFMRSTEQKGNKFSVHLTARQGLLIEFLGLLQAGIHDCLQLAKQLKAYLRRLGEDDIKWRVPDTALIFRDHSDQSVNSLSWQWMQHIVKYSYRDQPSLLFLLFDHYRKSKNVLHSEFNVTDEKEFFSERPHFARRHELNTCTCKKNFDWLTQYIIDKYGRYKYSQYLQQNAGHFGMGVRYIWPLTSLPHVESSLVHGVC